MNIKNLQTNSKNVKLFYFLAIISFLLIFFLAPITQNLQYHLFAEQRIIEGIPHFGDVISNFSFIVCGILLYFHKPKIQQTLAYPTQGLVFNFFCLSCIALGFGSAYYHINPNNTTLIADRATMVLGFAVIFFDTCIQYYIFRKTDVCSKFAVTVLLFFMSVIYWAKSGRLEPYVFVQFFSMFVIIIVALRNYKNTKPTHLLLMGLFYFLAKIFEYEDHQIFTLTNCVSGHTLKHIAYAFSLYFFGQGLHQISVTEEAH